MTEVTNLTKLASLETTANKLNTATNSMNRILEAVEKRLVDLNVGLATWLTDTPLATIPGEERGGWETSREILDELGFAKVHGKWCLAVRRKVVVHGFYQGDSECPFQEKHADGDPVALVSASRDLRLRALNLLPELLQLVERDARNAIAAIEKAAALLK